MRWDGATNPGEFFAVATEVFFEQPRELAGLEPELYDVLTRFYRQDPAAREP
jgi:Mlc titration factor MtfA (ptsG expression regulator)